LLLSEDSCLRFFYAQKLRIMFTITELSTERINSILTEALAFANGKTAKIEGEVFCSNLFFEDSTRTKTSFDIAERKLGLTGCSF
jgi:aspartate carbamoyltransferase catalytic subunit